MTHETITHDSNETSETRPQKSAFSTNYKLRNENGVKEVIFLKSVNGIEHERYRCDYRELKQIISEIEGRLVGIQIVQKNNSEMQSFVTNVSLLQSNYQLVIVKSLLEKPELSKSELISIIKNINENQEIKDIGAFDVLLRKGIIKRNVEGLYQINSDLSEQNSERLSKLAESRLEVRS